MVVSDMKEKYGTWRVYCNFGPNCIHDITHNGYGYIQYKGLLLRLYYKTYKIQSVIFQLLGHVLYPIQKRWYRQVYKMAIKKFPKERRALLNGADWQELLKGL